MSHPTPSSAFQSLLDKAKRDEKKYARQRRSNHTIEHLLLDERAARALRQDRVDAFSAKVAAGVEARDVGSSKLTGQDKRQLRLITGGGISKPTKTNFCSLASNPHAREVFYDATYQRLKDIHADADVKMYFATIIDRRWCLQKGDKHFDITLMVHRAKRALRDIGYEGILFLEIQAVTNLKEAKFLPHLHGFVWRRNGEGLGPKKAEVRLNKRFQGIRQAKGVALAVIPRDKPNALPTRFFYATKLPHVSKSYMPDPGSNNAFIEDKPGKLKTAAESNYTKLGALRIVRFLAQYEIDDTAFAVGKEGTQVRKAGTKKLTEFVEKKGLRDGPSASSVVKLLSKVLRD